MFNGVERPRDKSVPLLAYVIAAIESSVLKLWENSLESVTPSMMDYANRKRLQTGNVTASIIPFCR